MKHREACERDEFATPASPPDLKVVQITSDTSRDSGTVYIDRPSWTPDAKRFVFSRAPSEDGSRQGGLWLCDTEDNFAIRPLVEYQQAATMQNFSHLDDLFCGSCLRPDGTAVYTIRRKRDALEVTHLDLLSSETRVVCTAPAPLNIRGAMTISGDGRHLVFGVWLGDGKTAGAPWGIYVFDVVEERYWVTEFGNGFRNMHCQYSKNPEPPFCYDLSINGTDGKLSDGSWLTPPDGSWRWQNMPPPFPPGQGSITTHHVVRDNGTHWRMLPIGDGDRICSGGHNSFRGLGENIFCATYDLRGGKWRAPIVEATPVPLDRDNPEYWRGQLAEGVPQPIDLSRKLARADSCHIAGDRAGKHLVSDTDGYVEGKYSFLWAATVVEPDDEAPWLTSRYLLLTRSSYKGQPEHAHQVLSPDGRYVVFQSDFTGRPQVNVAYNFDYPEP